MSVNKFIGGQLKMVAGLTPGGGGTGSIIKVQLSSTKGNTISNVGITLNIKNKEYSSITDNDGVAIFNGVTEVGTMTVTATAEEFPSQTFKIEFFGSYELIMLDSDPYEDWLAAAGLNPASYEDIDELLEDEAAVRALMTKTAAVDILANYITGERLEKIINHRYAAKWINYREYAYSTLSANEIIKELMDASGMYGMYITAESKSLPLIPPMTSNTGSNGVASASGEYSYGGTTYNAWKAFDGTTSGSWSPLPSQAFGDIYIQYKFNNPTVVNRIYISVDDYQSAPRVKSFIVKGSNDGSDWKDIHTVTDNKSNGDYHDFANDVAYLYYRLVITDGAAPNTTALTINMLQFYGYQLEALIPTMTSNTAPSGEAFSDSSYDGYPAWKAFDNNETTFYIPARAINNVHCGYRFTTPTCVNAVQINTSKIGTVDNITFYVQASNNDTNWVTLTEQKTITTTSNTIYSLDNNEHYLQYRILFTSVVHSSSNNGWNINTIQFYGKPTFWQPKGLVPVMTSNTAPYGVASAQDQYDATMAAYKAFDRDNDTKWNSSVSINKGGGVATSWIQYKFSNPTKISKVTFLPRTSDGVYPWQAVKIQGSNDSSTWTDLYSDETVRTEQKIYELEVLSNSYFTYVRMQMTVKNNHTVNGPAIGLLELQFYGRQLEALIPPMTSNTTPIGEAFCSGVYSSGYDAYKAFNDSNNSEDCWSVSIGATNEQYIGYRFTTPTIVRRIGILATNSDRVPFVFKLQGSNNGINYLDLTTNLTCTKNMYTGDSYDIFEVSNVEKYMWYRVYFISGTGGYYSIPSLQFYGAPDYESRTYIYDHGVEVIPLTAYTEGGGIANKESDYLYLYKNGIHTVLSNFYTTNKINLTNYSLIRVCADLKLSTNTTRYFELCTLTGVPITATNQGYYSSICTIDTDNGLIDISTANQELYICIDVLTGSNSVSYMLEGSVSEWWLE